MDGDKNLRVVTLLRTSENKFYRVGVDDAEELQDGFPKTREELYRYRGLILGSIEASFFSADQLRMIGEFVSERGGGLLMLGGRHSFSEGGYASLDNVLRWLLDFEHKSPFGKKYREMGEQIQTALRFMRSCGVSPETVPALGFRIVLKMRSKVVFPAPLGPRMPKIAPGTASKLTPPSATIRPRDKSA